ncbi:Ig-like domain-containing protein, partial [candidate division KSB1 bacterium]
MKNMLIISIVFLTKITQAEASDLGIPPTWSVNPADYSNTMTMTAQLSIDGEISTDTEDMVGVFVGDECRGVANASLFPINDTYIFSLTIYSNTTGEILTFKAWDNSIEQIIELNETYEFLPDANVGDGLDPFSLTGVTSGTGDVPPTWSVNPADYSNTMTMTAQLSIDGEISTDTEDMVGVFVGDECCGVANASLFPINNTYIFSLTIYSNTTGEILTFKAWDNSSKQIIELNETYEFLPDANVGDGLDPFVLSWPVSGPTIFVIDSIKITPSVLTINVEDSIQFQAEVLDTAGILVDTTVIWSVLDNDIGTIDTTGLFIATSTGTTKVTAAIADITDTASVIVTDPNINTVEFYRMKSDGKVTKSGSTINEGETKTLGGLPSPLNFLNGGKLTFPENSLSEDITITIKLPEFSNTQGKDVTFGDNIVTAVTFEVSIDGEISIDENDIVAAFVGEECRGVANASLFPINDTYIFSLTIYSNTTGEILTFKAWDNSIEQIVELNETYEFLPDANVGNGLDPFGLTGVTNGTGDVPPTWSVNPADYSNTMTMTAQLSIEGDVIIISPYVFDIPLELTLPFKKGLLNNLGIDPLDLGMFFVTAEGELLSDGITDVSIDPKGNKITANVAHFSDIAVGVEETFRIVATILPIAVEGEAYSYPLEVLGCDVGDEVIFELIDGPAWLSINTATGELSGTPGANDVGSCIPVILSATLNGETSTTIETKINVSEKVIAQVGVEEAIVLNN